MINVYEISIIVVNYKTPDLIVDCLETLLPETVGLNACIVLVDNNSADGSIPIIESWLNENDTTNLVKFIKSEKNLGFAGGNNMGIRAFEAKNYILLNSDTLVRRDAIKILFETANNYPDIGLVSPRLEWPDSTPQVSCFRYISAYTELIQSASTSIITKLFNNENLPLSIQGKISYPEWTSFACVLIKNTVFEQIGLLDEKFFMYFDDVEFCFRANNAGFGILNNPSSRIVHLRGGSSSVKKNIQNRKRLPYYFYESRTWYFYKCYGYKVLILANLLWMLGRSISKIRELVGAKKPHVCEKQWLDIWTNWRHPERANTKS